MAGAADRCAIPESPFDMEKLTELMVEDRHNNPSKYSVLLVSEGATMTHHDEMSFEGDEVDMFGHKKLGGIGDKVSAELKALSPKYNNGKTISVVNQRLSYLVRCGAPDAFDSIVPMAFGNIALDLLMDKKSGRLISLRNGIYDNVPLDVIYGTKKVVDVNKYYDPDRMRPTYKSFDKQPLFIMTSD
jgi:6-phosphofructokinase 1